MTDTDELNADVVVIGVGPVGENVAQYAVEGGLSAALVEGELLGGECSYYACMPSKALLRPIDVAHTTAHLPGVEDAAVQPKELLARRDTWVSHYDDSGQVKWADGADITLVRGHGRIVGERRVEVSGPDGTRTVTAERAVVLATGSVPVVPPVFDGVSPWGSRDATGVVEVPERLLVVGGGVIAVEAATWMAALGSQVRMLVRGPALLEKNEPFAGDIVRSALEKAGIAVVLGADVTSAVREHADDTGLGRIHGGEVTVTTSASGTFTADEVLVATGRAPNTDGLNLDAAGIARNERGGIAVDEHLRTSAPNVWALGDVTGGPQFTYLSYDDFRIVRDDVLGDGLRTTENRGAIPRCTFAHPPFARIGITEREAREAGFTVRTATLPAENISQASILQDETGLMKVVVDAESDLVLGMDLFCEDAQELVNLVKIVMDARIPATALRDAVFTHPSMTEAFNNLIAALGDPS